MLWITPYYILFGQYIMIMIRSYILSENIVFVTGEISDSDNGVVSFELQIIPTTDHSNYRSFRLQIIRTTDHSDYRLGQVRLE